MKKTLRTFAQYLPSVLLAILAIAFGFAGVSILLEANGSGTVYVLASLFGVLHLASAGLSLLVALDR